MDLYGPWEANFWGPLVKKGPAGSHHGPNYCLIHFYKRINMDVINAAAGTFCAAHAVTGGVILGGAVGGVCGGRAGGAVGIAMKNRQAGQITGAVVGGLTGGAAGAVYGELARGPGLVIGGVSGAVVGGITGYQVAGVIYDQSQATSAGS